MKDASNGVNSVKFVFLDVFPVCLSFSVLKANNAKHDYDDDDEVDDEWH